MLAVDLLAPPEVLTALQDGRQVGRWVRASCPYCHGSQKRTLSASHTGFGPNKDRPGWLCHRCHAEEAAASERRQLGKLRYRATGRDDKHRSERAHQIFLDARPVDEGDPVDRYLRRRRLRPHGAFWPSCLRYARLRHPETKKIYPTMVGLVVDVAGMPIAVHRTFLTEDGRKADVSPVKMVLGPCGGGAIRLGIDSSTIVVAEGIESAFGAAMALGGVPWSTISASNMPKLVLPRDVHTVVIAPDHDDNDVGWKAALDLRAKIKKLQIAQNRIIDVLIKPPPRGLQDYADFKTDD